MMTRYARVSTIFGIWKESFQINDLFHLHDQHWKDFANLPINVAQKICWTVQLYFDWNQYEGFKWEVSHHLYNVRFEISFRLTARFNAK